MSRLPDDINAALLRAAELSEPRDGIRFLDRHEDEVFLSWIDIRERAERAGGTLSSLGIRSGDRVAIILPTGPDFIDAWFGCHWIGAIPVALYPPVRLGRLDEYFEKTAAMISSVEACTLIADKRVRRVLGRLMPLISLTHGSIKSETLTSGDPVPPYTVSPDDTAMVQFSSGTTVAPKPVALSHRQLIANADAIMDYFPLDDGIEHAGVSWLPLYHDMGLIGCIIPAVLRTGPLTLIPPEVFLARPAIWLRAISRYKATLSPAPDFAYGLCVDRIRDEELEDCDLSSWRLAMNGAESVSASRAQAFVNRFHQWGFRPEAMTPVYGLSEAALAVCFSDPTQPFRHLVLDSESLSQGQIRIVEPDSPPLHSTHITSVGRPLRGFEVEIRDRDGTALPEASLGRIWVSGPSLMTGYLGGLPSPIEEGWLHTGDLGFIYDQEVYISGRAKDVIVLRGRNHSPSSIEDSLFDVEEVRRGCTAAVGLVDSEGDRLLVFVEVQSPKKDTAERCRATIRAATGLDADLVVVIEPGVLPRTSSGKIRRAEALRRWQTGELLPPDRVTPWMLTGALARSALGYLRSRS